jgi:hypothetical protein
VEKQTNLNCYKIAVGDRIWRFGKKQVHFLKFDAGGSIRHVAERFIVIFDQHFNAVKHVDKQSKSHDAKTSVIPFDKSFMLNLKDGMQL